MRDTANAGPTLHLFHLAISSSLLLEGLNNPWLSVWSHLEWQRPPRWLPSSTPAWGSQGPPWRPQPKVLMAPQWNREAVQKPWQSHEAHKLHVWRLECSPSSSGPDAAHAIQPLLFRGTVPDVVVRGVMEDIKINKLEPKWYKWTYLQIRNRLTDMENKLVVTSGETEGEKGKIGVWD